MAWHMVNCTFPGCGQAFPSISPGDRECPDSNHHYNLRQRQTRNDETTNIYTGKKSPPASTVPSGKKGKNQGRRAADKPGCDMVLIPAAALIAGVVMGIVKVLR